MRSLCFVIFMRGSKPDKQRGQHGKDKGLQERDKNLKQIDKYGKRHRHKHCHNIALQNKADKNQAENYDVPGSHVGKKPDGQCKWFGKQTDNLDWNHDNPERPVRTRGKMSEIPLDAVSLDS